ncbi:MAG: hypothetical protein KIT84_04120 [Labilithrix sp.]|nr:hypothetical protein [Labilithrix sp.]MCW5810172.1 hypothetical protein [Labilithrix sp.]
MGRLAERTSVRLALFALLALVVVWPMLAHAGWVNEFRDAQVLTVHERAAALTVKTYRQLPLWDPWYCGGLYGLGAPQSRFAAPPFLLTLLFGVERAQPVIVWLLAVLGMEGTFRWLRLRVTDATAALRIAPLFALSGHFAVAWFRGWVNFFGFELVPFVLYGITVAARGRTHGIAVAAIAFATILGFGGTFAAPLIAVAAAAESARVLLELPPARRGRAIAMLFALASFMLTAAAVRLLPIAEVLAAQPRIMAGTPGHSPLAILFFLVRSLEVKDGDVEDLGMFYVGGAFLALIALGGSERKSIRPLVVVILFMWLSAGYARKPALFALLRELPIFSALRYPERFLWLGILFACEPAAHALAKVPRLGEGKSWRRGANALLTLAVLASLGAEVKAFYAVDSARNLGVATPDRSRPFRQSRGNRWLASHYESAGLGSLSCWETHPVTMSPLLRGDLAQEEYLAPPARGAARRVSWSPNEIVVHVSLAEPGRLLVNQNWHPGWTSSIGNVVSQEGLLAVDLPAGDADVKIAFRPRSALAGGAVTLVALVSLGLLALGARRGRPAFRRGAVLGSSLLVLLPWATLAAFVATWPSPRFPPPPLKNPNGEPAIVSAPPADVPHLGAQLDVPLVVDAARTTGPDPLGNVFIDLWIRRTGALARTTAMYVHFKRREGQEPPDKERSREYLNGDHQVVGGSFYLSDAPENAVVHDSFGMFVGKSAPGTWDVWLGFGHVSGRRRHAKFVEAAQAEVRDDMIRIGTFVVP